MDNQKKTQKNLLTKLKSKIIKESNGFRPLGVGEYNGKVILFYQSKNNYEDGFNTATSTDGFNFQLQKKDVSIRNAKQKKEIIRRCQDFHIVKTKKNYFLIYSFLKDNTSKVHYAYSSDFSNFFYDCSFESHHKGAVIPEILYKKQHIIYTGKHSIYLALSKDLYDWDIQPLAALAPRHTGFDKGGLEPAYADVVSQGVLLFYYSKVHEENHSTFRIGAALFDKKDPEKLIWRSDEALWEPPQEWENAKVQRLGVAKINGEIIAYFHIEGEGIYGVVLSYFDLDEEILKQKTPLKLKKGDHNPILVPNNENHWEAFNTFNPAAFYDNGKIHLIYRAQGFNYVSVLGYATTQDGFTINERLNDPIYTPSADFEGRMDSTDVQSSLFYGSGGGFGGCEDPRITKIGERIYMTYVAYDGYSPPRIALTSIAANDFLNRRWLWEKPVLITPPGVVDKSAVIFPEKIRGKYVIMHRVYPDILIDFVDNLHFDGSTWLKGESKIGPRVGMWDSRKIGAGAPPLRTKDGWLLIYQSVGNQDSSRYKIGAMLLDLDDPTKVLYRCNAPILEPTETYENDGFKAGVVYPCGAVIFDKLLFVYYGGADSYVCVAHENLDEFLSKLKTTGKPKLENMSPKKINHKL